jgi:plastocyanin domain-containing protein
LSSGSQERGVLEPTATIVDGKQYVDITARGGYWPREIKAKSGVPTILRVATKGTFDCSAYLVIPTIGYRNSLPQTGVTEIPIPPQQAGSTFVGTCSMGMYSFAIKFE